MKCHRLCPCDSVILQYFINGIMMWKLNVYLQWSRAHTIRLYSPFFFVSACSTLIIPRLFIDIYTTFHFPFQPLGIAFFWHLRKGYFIYLLPSYPVTQRQLILTLADLVSWSMCHVYFKKLIQIYV